MKSILFFIFLFALIPPAFAQSPAASVADSNQYLASAEEKIAGHRYADAQNFLNEAIRTTGFQPELVCLMVDNALQHAYMQRDFQVFYLRNLDGEQRNGRWQNASDADNIAVLRHPDRMLQKTLSLNPQFSWAYKLMGDYYNLQLELPRSTLKITGLDGAWETREKVFSYYNRAAQQGFQDARMNRWLGDYFRDAGQMRMARKFYQQNIDQNFNDLLTFYQMAIIHFNDKKYSEAYNFALKSLQNYTYFDLQQRYRLTRIAAQSLFHVGEIASFMDYSFECIQLIPDIQDAYIDLVNHYSNAGKTDMAKKMLRRMLMRNPYDTPGFARLEKFCTRNYEYGFAEDLLEEIMMNYEHSDAVVGNIYQFKGNLLFLQGQPLEAKRLWQLSRSYHGRYLPPDSPFLKQIGDVSQDSSGR